MYESHFGITGPPFQLSPDPNFYFDSKGHHDVLAALRRGLSESAGFVVISGEIGAGKTTLVRTLLEEFDLSSIVVGQVLSTQLDAAELLDAVLIAFGVVHAAEGVAAAKEAVLRQIAVLAKEGRRAVLIIDEAQNLHRDALLALAELEREAQQGRAPLKVLLVGQPELRDMVESPPLQRLRERAGVSCHLGPLDASETAAYIRHRLECVGWAGVPRFDSRAFAEAHRWTQGVPRRVNLLCNRVMLACFLTAQARVDAAMVERTARDLRSEIGDASPEPLPLRPPDPFTAASAPTPLDSAGEAERRADAPPLKFDRRRPGPLPPQLPSLGGHDGSGPLLCVVGGQADHVKAAALMVALAARSDVPAALLVRAGNSDVADRNAALFAGLDRGRFIQLAIGDGTAVGRAAELMKRFEFVVDHCEPSAVVVFDGSEVALYAGLVANHKNVPVLHVGAGLRVRDAFAKADATRRLLDEVSDVLYAPDADATAQLVREGVPAARVRFVGNLLVDAMQNALRAPADESRASELAVVQAFLADRHGYAVVVADAMAGASNRQGLSDLVAMMRQVSRDVPLIWPMQAHTRDQLVKFKLDAVIADERIVCMPTLPYASFVQLLGNATCVLTDSWSVQEEATALGIPCLTLGSEPARFVASKVGGSTAVGNNKALATRAVWECIFNGGKRGRVPDLWDGQAAGRIAEHIAKWLVARRATPPA